MIPQHRMLLLSGLLALAPNLSHAATWLETQIEIEELAAAKDYGAAAGMFDDLVEQVRLAFGDSSAELAGSYLLVADVQTRNGEYLEAIGNIVKAIEIHERNEGPLSSRLIEPYIALGDTYDAAREPELALFAFEQARAISRREFGLLNEGQIPILDRMTRSLPFDDARELQLEAVNIVQRLHGEDSREYLDANYRYAEWLVDMSAYGYAELAYHDMHRIIDEHFGGDPMLRVELLRTNAANLRGTPAVGFRAKPKELEEALSIVKGLDRPDPVLHAAVLRDIGDWNAVHGHVDDVVGVYLKAWDILGSVDGGENLQREWFSDQTVVGPAPLLSGVQSTDPLAPWARVDVTFTVDTRGRPVDVHIASSDPPGLFDRAAIRETSKSRFRPRIVDGELVASPGFLTFSFQYDEVVAEALAEHD